MELVNKEQEAFELVKEKLISRPILSMYSSGARTETHTDACQIGFGGSFTPWPTLVSKQHPKKVDTIHNEEKFNVPRKARWKIVNNYHDNFGHIGLDKTVLQIREYYWFP